MLQQKRLISLPLVGVILLCLFAVLFFAGRKRANKPNPSDKEVYTHTVEKRPDEVRKYWTEENIRKAKPAPMPQTDNLKPGKEQTRH